MNILITGGKGSIGSYLCNSLSSDNQVYALGRNELDVCDRNAVESTISVIKPDILIHCAALTNIDFCENNETSAYTVNTIGSLNVAQTCSKLSIPIIYISTNYVYGDYKKEPYVETDKCNPINIYGKTKLEGEKLIRTICSKYFILRTSWVFGGSNCYIKKSLEKKSSPLFLCSDEITNATYIEDLASVISTIIHKNKYGLYNCVNKNPTSKYNVMELAFKLLEIEKPLIKIPQNYISNSAPRPSYSVLNTSFLKSEFNIELPSWDMRLNQYIETLKK